MPVSWITAADTVEPDNEYAQDAVNLATYILYKLSGEKYQGTNTAIEHYGIDSTSSYEYQPEVVMGQIVNIPVLRGHRIGNRRLYLVNRPVKRVNSVVVNGITLAPAKYSLRNNSYLVRTDNKLWMPNEKYDIAITYDYGVAPPPAGIEAVIQLANQFIWAETDNSLCTLPERVTTISRQNVTIGVLDPQDFLENGRTGILAVDLFLKASNATKSQRKTKIYSVDKPRGERIN